MRGTIPDSIGNLTALTYVLLPAHHHERHVVPQLLCSTAVVQSRQRLRHSAASAACAEWLCSTLLIAVVGACAVPHRHRVFTIVLVAVWAYFALYLCVFVG